MDFPINSYVNSSKVRKKNEEEAKNPMNMQSMKLEYDLDIKLEDLETFGLGVPAGGRISLDDVDADLIKLQAESNNEFCDNDSSSMGVASPLSISSSIEPTYNNNQETFQRIQAYPQSRLPLATFPIESYDTSNSGFSDHHEDDIQLDSEYMEIHQQLEQELENDDLDHQDLSDQIHIVPTLSPDTDDYASQFSVNNSYQAGRNDELFKLANFHDHIYQDIYNEAVGEAENIDAVTITSIEEEWKKFWNIRCNQCAKSYSQNFEFDAHYLNRHAANPIYKCSYCDKEFLTYVQFYAHGSQHITRHRFLCTMCPKGFSLRAILKIHYLTKHPNDRPFECDQCDKRFVTKSSLIAHSRKHKKQTVFYSCNVCNKTLYTKGGFTSHMSVHRLGRRFMCEICGNTFTQKVNMQQHLKQHTGERPWPCDECDKSFAEKSHLSRHKSLHKIDRPYICELCGSSFKTERCRKVHYKVHDEVRDHKCETCGKTFLSTSKLKQHNNTHTGERPYECSYCERTFTNYPNWLKHTKRKHKVHHITGERLSNSELPKNTKTKKTNKPKKVDPVQEVLKEDVKPVVHPNVSDISEGQDNLLQLNLKAAESLAPYMADDSQINLQYQMIPQLLTNQHISNLQQMGFVLPYQQVINYDPTYQNQLLIETSPQGEQEELEVPSSLIAEMQQQLLYEAPNQVQYFQDGSTKQEDPY